MLAERFGWLVNAAFAPHTPHSNHGSIAIDSDIARASLRITSAAHRTKTRKPAPPPNNAKNNDIAQIIRVEFDAYTPLFLKLLVHILYIRHPTSRKFVKAVAILKSPWIIFVGVGMINSVDESDRNFGIQIEENSLIVTHMRAFRHRIELAKSAQTTRPISDYFYEVLNTPTPYIFAPDIACKKGCSYCCNTWVYATAPEIFHLASSLSTENAHAFTMPVKAAADVRQKIPAEVRSAHLSPCPILKDGECSRYDARPAACRTAYSLDAMACQRALLDPLKTAIPIPEFPAILRAAFAIALDGALLNAGYSLVRYELRTALDIALSLPDGEKAWLLGQEIFGSSLRDTEEDFLASPIKLALYAAAFP